MSDDTSSTGSGPRFSIVSAVYNVAAYLDEFIASVEAQDRGLADVEVVMVDDGSTDGSAEILDRWRQRRPDLVTVLRKANGGQSSARNLGLEHARGQWVTFTDPDDMWEPDALSHVDRALAAEPDVQLAGMRRVLLDDATRERTPHPLEAHFHKRIQVRDLDTNPLHFFGSAPAAFFRRDEIERQGLRFREDIRPSFEDGYFCCEYLLGVPRPVVAFVRDAVYLYRKRADGSSTLNQGRDDVRRYTTLLRTGYLGIAEESIRRTGRVPGWLQTYLIYELYWFFVQEQRSPSQAVVPIADEVHDVLARIAAVLDESIIRTFTLRKLRPEVRDMLLRRFDDSPWHCDTATVDRVDMQQRLVRVTYRFIGPVPDEQWLVDGEPVQPVAAKIRTQPYFQRVLVRHRVAWLPYGSAGLLLDGRPMIMTIGEPEKERAQAVAWRVRDTLLPRFAAAAVKREATANRLPFADRLAKALAGNRIVRRLLRQSWVLMDRIHDADDSAEHLFRYLRDERPGVKAWFVIQRGVPHDRRLRADGYRRRVVPHGGLRWKVLMLNCEVLISSHADIPLQRAPQILRLTEPTWKDVFLQHGVTKDDLSSWLNAKKLSLFVVSTPGELHSVIDDDTAYDYTALEAKLTGLPRFDKVRAVGQQYPPERRDLLLVAPTWRQWLVRSVKGSQRWTIDAEGFRTSQFATQWTALLASLERVAEEQGLRLGLLMHPNLQQVVGELGLSHRVALFDFEDAVHDVFGRARVLVTDYSSMAFNAAYIERPVVYFQFDRDRMLGGQHVGTKGYFEYERDGFGPVVETVDAATSAVATALADGPGPAEQYLHRIRETFPQRDGRCCERVADAVAALSQRYPTTAGRRS